MKRKKNCDTVKNLEIDLSKRKYSDTPDKLQKVLQELNKIQVVDENLHEIRSKN